MDYTLTVENAPDNITGTQVIFQRAESEGSTSKLDQILANQATLQQGMDTMAANLKDEVTQLAATIADLNQTIPAYISGRDAIDEQLKAATAQAVSDAVASA